MGQPAKLCDPHRLQLRIRGILWRWGIRGSLGHKQLGDPEDAAAAQGARDFGNGDIVEAEASVQSVHLLNAGGGAENTSNTAAKAVKAMIGLRTTKDTSRTY